MKFKKFLEWRDAQIIFGFSYCFFFFKTVHIVILYDLKTTSRRTAGRKSNFVTELRGVMKCLTQANFLAKKKKKKNLVGNVVEAS